MTRLTAAALVGLLLGCPAAADSKDAAPVPYPYKPYDGTGSYTMAKEPAPDTMGIQDLRALRTRWGYKPYDKLWNGKNWQAERAIFRDVTTGAEVWMLTHDIGSDSVQYHKGNWNADGSYVVWRRRPGMWEPSTKTHGPTAMRSDGTGLRPIAREFRMVRKIQCSRTDPALVYIMVGDKELHAFDIRTGKSVKNFGNVGGCWHLKLSIDGKYVCGYWKDPQGQRRVWIVSTDGKERYSVTLDKPTHDSYYIHPTLKYVLFWYEGDYRTEGFRMKSFDNKDEIVTGVLFDWNHGDFGLAPVGGTHVSGRLFAVSADGKRWAQPVNAFAPDKSKPYYDRPVSPRNGYSSWMPKDEPWAFGSALVLRPWVSELFLASVLPVDGDVANRFRICVIGNRSNGSLDGCDGSPDGTKVIYNSDMLGCNQVFYVVARRPEPPVDLTAKRTSGGVALSWKPAKHHKETAGYNVYRSGKSGRGYVQINAQPLIDTDCVDPSPGKDAFYVVTAVEHSTQESGYSNEATAGKATARVVFAEAERGPRGPAVWKAFSGDASDLYYIWMRKKGAAGKATVPVTLPAKGKYTVWARVKGGAFTIAGRTAAAKGDQWQWVNAGAASLDAGRRQIEVASDAYGSALDAMCFSTDPTFTPDGKNALDRAAPQAVGDVRVDPDGPFAAEITWAKSPAKDVHHYNLYVGAKPDFAIGNRTLIASPASNRYLDWQVDPKAKACYKVTAVDRRGNESAPSEAAELRPPALDRAHVEAELKEGKGAFELPADGRYVVWLHFVPKERNGGYVHLDFDDGKPKATWSLRRNRHLSGKGGWISYGQFGAFDLTAGKHTLAVKAKSDTIDKVIVTNDRSFRPSGYFVAAHAW